METKKVFEETKTLEDKIMELRSLLAELNLKYKDVVEECHHEIVFKYNDNDPRKMIIDGNYYCPACGKLIKCLNKGDKNKSVFKYSRVIPLKELSLRSTKEVLEAIRTEVYNNMELYYDNDIKETTLSSKMEELLKDKQSEYQRTDKVLERVKKRFKL